MLQIVGSLTRAGITVTGARMRRGRVQPIAWSEECETAAPVLPPKVEEDRPGVITH